jgi:hypothetical protein
MIAKLIPLDGIGRGQVLVLPVSQVILETDDGTPIFAAAHYGPDGAYSASMAGMEDFNRLLRRLGVSQTTVVDRIRLSGPPPGAQLIAGPRPRE